VAGVGGRLGIPPTVSTWPSGGLTGRDPGLAVRGTTWSGRAGATRRQAACADDRSDAGVSTDASDAAESDAGDDGRCRRRHRRHQPCKCDRAEAVRRAIRQHITDTVTPWRAGCSLGRCERAL